MRVLARSRLLNSQPHDVTVRVTLHEVDVDEEGFIPGTTLGHATVHLGLANMHVNALSGGDYPAPYPKTLQSHALQPYLLDDVAVQTWCQQGTWTYAVEPVTFQCKAVHDITFYEQCAVLHLTAPPCAVTLKHHHIDAVDTTILRHTLSCPDVVVPLTSIHSPVPECLMDALHRYAEGHDVVVMSEDVYPDTTECQRVLYALYEQQQERSHNDNIEVEIYY